MIEGTSMRMVAVTTCVVSSSQSSLRRNPAPSGLATGSPRYRFNLRVNRFKDASIWHVNSPLAM